ncbi:MAG: hypothetical protein ACYSUQ_13785 [Planctomycetota bacterium]|jgi:hypothetical protein
MTLVSKRRHRRRLANLARSLGLNYNPHDALNLPQRYHGLTLMREGHDRRAWDVLSGPARAGALSCYAYRYETGFGVARALRRWVIAVLETDQNWGRVAVRKWAPGSSDEPPWDTGMGTRPLDSRGNQAVWTVTSPSSDQATAVPETLLDWLDDLEQSVCLEICDHLVALQIPLGRAEEQMERMVAAVQEAIERLDADSAAGAGEAPSPHSALRDPKPGGGHVRA